MFRETSAGPPFPDTPSPAPLGGRSGAGCALAGWGGPVQEVGGSLPAGPRSRRMGCSRPRFPQEGEGGQGAAGTERARSCWKLVVQWTQVDLLQVERPRSTRGGSRSTDTRWRRAHRRSGPVFPQ